jgi:hypothetical protein
VNLFGKAFAHVRSCLWKEKHMYGTNKNIDGLTDSTRKRNKYEDFVQRDIENRKLCEHMKR